MCSVGDNAKTQLQCGVHEGTRLLQGFPSPVLHHTEHGPRGSASVSEHLVSGIRHDSEGTAAWLHRLPPLVPHEKALCKLMLKAHVLHTLHPAEPGTVT